MANLEWQQSIGTVESDLSYCTTTLNNDVFVLGHSNSNTGIFTSNNGEYDFWLAELSIPSVGMEGFFEYSSLAIYPNPSTGNSITLSIGNNYKNVHLTCFNTFGLEVLHQQKINTSETAINISSWKSGIYLAVLHKDGKPMGRAKFVVQ